MAGIYSSIWGRATLLAADTPAQTLETFRYIAGTRRLPLTIVETTKTDEFARYESDLILIRPDAFVAWTNSEKFLSNEDVENLLKAVI
jgi:hypothetical protein